MNIEVIYATMSGHSKKLANAIASKFGIKAKNIEESPDLKNVDILFICSGVYGGLIKPELEKYINDINPDNIREAVLVMSSMSQDYSKSTLNSLLKKKGINVADKLGIERRKQKAVR